MSSMNFRVGDGTAIRAEASYTNMWSEGHTEFDPKWSAYDVNGHFHVAVRGKRGRVEFPTLRELWVLGHCGTCNDWHDEGELSDGFECKLCDDYVVPGVKYVPGQSVSVLNHVDYWREGEILCTAAEAQELLVSGVAASVSGGVGEAVRVRIHEYLTKAQFEEYAREFQGARGA